MKRKTLVHFATTMIVAVMLAAVPALAQKSAAKPFTPQITGELGSPDTTTTISGEQLPRIC